MVDEVCPNCGYVFPCRGRGRTGQGTRRGRSLKKLTRNHIQLFHVLRVADKPITVHEASKLLFTGKNGSPLKFLSRKGEKNWNYHDIQAQLSLLVGAKLVSMSEPFEESFDWGITQFVSKPAPKYWLTNEQRQKFAKLLHEHQGIAI